MEEVKFFKSTNDFRKWLEKNFDKKVEQWIGFYKKDSGKPSIDWSQSVDVALCFGWIDGIRKSIDELSYKIRFTPRKPTSTWSAVNIKKVEELNKQGLMHPAGLEAYSKLTEKNTNRYSFERKAIELPADYKKLLMKKKKAFKYFQSQPPSYQKPAIYWVMSAKQEETRLKRLNILINSSAAGEVAPPFKWAKRNNAKNAK